MCKNVEKQGSSHVQRLKLKDWTVPGICNLCSMRPLLNVQVTTVGCALARSWRTICAGSVWKNSCASWLYSDRPASNVVLPANQEGLLGRRLKLELYKPAEVHQQSCQLLAARMSRRNSYTRRLYPKPRRLPVIRSKAKRMEETAPYDSKCSRSSAETAKHCMCSALTASTGLFTNAPACTHHC